MLSVFEFLTKNSEWLFSGVGAVAISFIGKKLWDTFNPEKPLAPIGGVTHVTNIMSGHPLHPTPERPAYGEVSLERAYLTKRIRVGDYFDLVRNSSQTIRITVVSIVNIDDKASILKPCPQVLAATLKTDLGGGVLQGGERTEMVSTNIFRLPQAKRDEAEDSVYSFLNTVDYSLFIRILVEHINPNAGEVDVNITHIVGIVKRT